MTADAHGRPPLIGVTGRRWPAEALYPQDPETLGGLRLDAYFVSYARCVVAAGGLAVFLPRESDPRALVDRLDGVVLAGGLDLDPAVYGGDVTAETTVLDPEQDAFDVALARAAIADGVPVVGTCRGHEVLNVALGGTLADHCRPEHNQRRAPAAHRSHDVSIAEGSLLHTLYGERACVNSLHHQSIASVGREVRITARSHDGVVEAIELPGQPAIGVQWHPEFLDGPDPVMRWLVAAAQDRASNSDHATVS
jgi:putative glutamine amidotransferase